MRKNPYTNYKDRSVAEKENSFSSPMITTRRFAALPKLSPNGYDRKPQFNTETQNVHTLFRRSFTVSGKVKSAFLFITGDDLYKAYLDGNYIGEGPAQSFPYAYNYNCYEVSDLLSEGENTLAVHVYYQGLFNIYLISADNRCGLLCELVIEYADGKKVRIGTDGEWKYRECNAYTARHTFGYQTQFSEDIDLAAFPAAWRENGFDDTGWESAVCTDAKREGYLFVPQITPAVSLHRVCPKQTKKTEGGYLLDFGRETVGSLHFTAKGAKGQTIHLRYAEELNAEGRARYEIRANCTYEESVTLTGGEDFFETYDYKGYRYAEILNPPKGFDPAAAYTMERHYPFPEKSARFACSDEGMNRIFEICKTGVRIGTQETYYDCPTREKGGFVGDALITGLSHLLLTGDVRIYKKFILDCKETGKHCPVIPAHLPTYDINFCADYSLLIPLFLKEYYSYTGDLSLVRELFPTLEGILGYFTKFKNEHGVLSGIRHFDGVPDYLNPHLIDWPQNLRDGYDMEKATAGICTTVNVFYYGFLKTAAELYDLAGESARIGADRGLPCRGKRLERHRLRRKKRSLPRCGRLRSLCHSCKRSAAFLWHEAAEGVRAHPRSAP